MVEEGWVFSSFTPRGGLTALACGSAAPPELVWWVNMRCVAAIGFHRNLFQARRADIRTAGGASHRWDRMEFFSSYLPGPVGPGMR